MPSSEQDKTDSTYKMTPIFIDAMRGEVTLPRSEVREQLRYCAVWSQFISQAGLQSG